MSKDTLIKYSDINDNRSIEVEGATGEVLNGYAVITASIYNAIREAGADPGAVKATLLSHLLGAIEDAEKLTQDENQEGEENGL